MQSQYNWNSESDFESNASRTLDRSDSEFDKDVSNAEGGGSFGVGGFKLGGGGSKNVEHLKDIRHRWQETEDKSERNRLLQEFSQLVADQSVLQAWERCITAHIDLEKQRNQLAKLICTAEDDGPDTVVVKLVWHRGGEKNAPETVKIERVQLVNLSATANAAPTLSLGAIISNRPEEIVLNRYNKNSAAHLIVTPEGNWGIRTSLLQAHPAP